MNRIKGKIDWPCDFEDWHCVSLADVQDKIEKAVRKDVAKMINTSLAENAWAELDPDNSDTFELHLPFEDSGGMCVSWEFSYRAAVMETFSVEHKSRPNEGVLELARSHAKYLRQIADDLEAWATAEPAHTS